MIDFKIEYFINFFKKPRSSERSFGKRETISCNQNKNGLIAFTKAHIFHVY